MPSMLCVVILVKWSLMELNVVNGGSQVAVAPATPSRARGWARGSRCLIHAGAARARPRVRRARARCCWRHGASSLSC